MTALALFFLLAAPVLHFQIIDGRGKEMPGTSIQAGMPDDDGWHLLTVAKAKGDLVLIWPFDGSAKLPDGREPIPAIVIQRGDEKVFANKRAIAAMATPVVLELATVEETARKTGFAADSLVKAFSNLATSMEPFEKGVGMLYLGKPAEAAEQFALALKQRERQLTRVPSEIYSMAVLYGQALYRSNKFDDSAVAFLTALRQRPSDETARKYRSQALIKAGKPEAAGR